MKNDSNNNSKPLVTVITLAYHSKYLKETVDSVLQQCYENVQYIITDDGTPGFDKAEWEKYIDRYKKTGDISYQVFHHESNIGTVKNLNSALHKAEGKYYVILAGDDTFADNMVLQDWVTYFEANKVLYATSYLERFDESMTHFEHRLPSEEDCQKIVSESPYALFEQIAMENFIVGCTTAYRKEFWEKYGDVPEQYHLIDDHPILLRALRNGEKIGWFPRSTIHYRSGGVSDVRNYNAIYKKDGDLIYKYEIAPYTKRPLRMSMAYKRWKWRQQNDKSFLKGYAYCQKHTALWFFLALRHPMRAKNKLIREIQRRQKCK